jgi:polar amino acid transport system substrate-binding protein
MRRFVSPPICVALVAVAALATTTAQAKGPPKPIKGSFSVCMDISFPPMEYFATPGSTKPIGFDVDLATAVAKLWGVKAKFVGTAFTGLLPALQAGRCTVVWSGIFVTPDRTKSFPAVGYMKTHRALLVQGGNPKKIKKPADLSGKTVATEAGTKYVDALNALDAQLKAAGKPGLNIQTYPKASDAVAQLVVGRADAVLTQDTEAAFRIGQLKGKIEIAYLYPQSDTFGVYYRKQNPAIGPGLKSAIAALKANGTLKRLANKYHLPLGDFGLKK